jgi:hypothetical protein
MSHASKLLGVGAVVLLAGVFVIPGCDSGGDDDDSTMGGSGGSSAGTGGSTMGGSSSGSGGSSAGTGGSSAGTGGSTGQVVTQCVGVKPTDPAIADFDMAPAAGAKYEWGSAAQGTDDFWGGTFNYPDALMLSYADGAMTAAGHITEYAGFGLYVQNCADASAYEGVRFKIKGNPPMGKMTFAVQTNKNEWANGTKGACLAPDAQKFINCVHPSFPITVSEADFTTIEVKWADLGAGKPAADAKTDGSDVIGLQFILPWAEKAMAYDASITIDDVEFIGMGAGGDGPGAGGAGNQPGAGGAGGAK